MSGVVTPEELKRLTEEIEAKKAQETVERLRKASEDERHLREAFIEQELRPDVRERVSAVIRRAAEQGQHEVIAMRFQAAWTNDHGRRINNNEPDWPASLEGFAKRGYQFYEKELKPLGYKLRAQVLSYPDGVPGEVGIFLVW
jgi:hypothetical protein